MIGIRILSIILVCILMACVTGTIGGCSRCQVTYKPISPDVRHVHHSLPASRKTFYHEAVIPFTLMKGHIFVDAVIDGTDYPCIVDTGTSDIVWPKTLKSLNSLPCQDTQQAVHFTGPNLTHIQGDWRTINDVHLRNYHLVGPRTVRLSHYFPSIGNNVIILGNAAFDPAVLTINYQKRELVVRSHQYDITKIALHEGDQLVPFTLIYDVPIFTVQVNQHPAQFMLDSGATTFIIKDAFCRRYGLHPQTSNEYFTSAFAKPSHVNYLSNADVTLATIPLGTPRMAVLGHLSTDIDGSLGMPLLEKYRITIDYNRGKMLLEPNANHL